MRSIGRSNVLSSITEILFYGVQDQKQVFSEAVLWATADVMELLHDGTIFRCTIIVVRKQRPQFKRFIFIEHKSSSFLCVLGPGGGLYLDYTGGWREMQGWSNNERRGEENGG